MCEYICCTREAAVATVTINRPKALNALNLQVLAELYEVMDALDQDGTVRTVILTGAGTRAFAAGADISAMSAMTPEEALAFARAGHRVMDRVASMGPVTIAAVNGVALGGGCELAMACDIRIASAQARMGIPETGLGVIPGFGGTQRLPRLVGLGRAVELLATGQQCKARECLELGLVSRVVEPEVLLESCMKLAERIAQNSACAVSLGKHCMAAGIEMDLHCALELEQKSFALTFASADQREGMSAFLEKRAPKFC